MQEERENLMGAIQRRDIVRVESSRVNPNFEVDGVDEDEDMRFTPLMYAIDNDHLEMINLLVEKGADVNYITSQQETALTYAIDNNKDNSAILLLEKGADVNDLLSLHLAINRNNDKIASVLIEMGANINHQDFIGYTALIWAVINNNLYITRLLLEHGADTDKRIINNLIYSHEAGYTALMIAAKKGYFDIVNLLLEYGADITIKHNGKWAGEIARENGHRVVAQLLFSVSGLIISDSNSSLDILFHLDPYLFTKMSKRYNPRAFNYFIDKYSILLNLPRDVVQNIF